MAFIRNLLASITTLVGLVVSIPILILSCPFCVVVLLTRGCARLLQPKYSPWKAFIEYDPTIGWKPKPNLDAYYMDAGDDVCHIRTDAQGWIGRDSLLDSDIVVFGDSFAFGYGVNLHESYLALNPQLKIKAIASPGYNMVQELLLMRQYAAQLRDKLVVWFVCLENDLLDNIRPNKPNFYRTPFVRRLGDTAEWEIETRHIRATKWPYPTIRHPYASVFAELFTPSPLSNFVYASCAYLLREGRDVCQQAGAELAILTIPQKKQLSPQGLRRLAASLKNDKDFDPNFMDERFHRICHELSLPYIPARKYLQARDYKSYDVHWTKTGHRRVAQLLSDLYSRYKSETLSSITSTSTIIVGDTPQTFIATYDESSE